jgi:hypothetical protein
MSYTFEEAFRSNMNMLRLPMPADLFTGLTTSLVTITGAAAAVERVTNMGRTMITVRELVRLGLVSEQLAVAGACLGVFYVSAMAGSLIIAAGQVATQDLYSVQGTEIFGRALRRGVGQRLNLSPRAQGLVLQGWTEQRARYLASNPIGQREAEIQRWIRPGSSVLVPGSPRFNF